MKINTKQLLLGGVSILALSNSANAQFGPTASGVSASGIIAACGATANQILFDNSGSCGGLTTIPVANGGTAVTAASITAFNNITGLSAAGTTGTTSTNLVFSTSPTLVTPTLGAATATSINGLTITASTGTLTVGATKTVVVSNTLTMQGTDSTTMTFPSTSATVARIDAGQTFTGTNIFAGQIRVTFGTPTISSGNCGATTNGTIVAGSTNQSGQITIGAGAATSCTVSFSATITAPVACLFSPANATAAASTTLARIGAPTSTAFIITGAVLASTNWAYICL